MTTGQWILIVLLVLFIVCIVYRSMHGAKHRYKNNSKSCKDKKTCHLREKVVWNYNLANFAVGGATDDFFYQVDNPAAPSYICDDGKVSYDSTDGSLTVDSSIFQKTSMGVLGHPQWLGFYKTPFAAPKLLPGQTEKDKCKVEELVFSADIKGFQSYSENGLPTKYHSVVQNDGGVENKNKDPRPACFAFNAVDPTTWTVADFIITNEQVYALLERLPFGRPEFGGSLGEYHAFTQMIPLCARSKTDDFVNYQIAYHQPTNTVRWLVDGVEYYRTSHLGYIIGQNPGLTVLNLGGQPNEVRPDSFLLGFGTFKLQDFSNPINPGGVASKGLQPLSNPSTYFQPQVTNPEGAYVPASFFTTDVYTQPEQFLFGQGAVMSIRNLKVLRRQMPPSLL